MSAPDWLLDIVRDHEKQRAEKLDAELAALVFTPDPSHLGRIVRTPLIERTGDAYMIPGHLFADGKARLITGEHTRVDEGAITWPDK